MKCFRGRNVCKSANGEHFNPLVKQIKVGLQQLINQFDYENSSTMILIID